MYFTPTDGRPVLRRGRADPYWRWRILARIRRFFRPTLRRPLRFLMGLPGPLGGGRWCPAFLAAGVPVRGYAAPRRRSAAIRTGHGISSAGRHPCDRPGRLHRPASGRVAAGAVDACLSVVKERLPRPEADKLRALLEQRRPRPTRLITISGLWEQVRLPAPSPAAPPRPRSKSLP